METDMTMLAGATVIGGILGIYSTLRLIYYIFYMIANWRIFSKAGEPGWKSLIPFYNVYTEYKLMWKPQLAWTYIGLGVFSRKHRDKRPDVPRWSDLHDCLPCN